MHCYIVTTTKQATLRASLRKLGLSGNKSYSLKELDIGDDGWAVEYLAYLLKEGKPKFVNIPQEVEDLVREYNERVVTEIKEKKEKKKTQLEQILALYEPDEWSAFNDRDIAQIVINWFVEKQVLFREFQAKSIVQTILLRYIPAYHVCMIDRLTN